MANKSLWLGSTDILELRKANRTVGASLDLTAAATAGAVLLVGLKSSQTIDAASIPANDSLDTAVTVTGAAVGDPVVVSAPAALENDVQVEAYVTAANTVRLRLTTTTAGAIDPASGTWKFIVLKF